MGEFTSIVFSSVIILLLLQGGMQKSKAVHAYCDTGWTSFNNSCFRLVHQNKTFNESSEACTGMNASLASMENQNVTSFAVENLTNQTSGCCWIGLIKVKNCPGNESTREEGWAWSDGTPFAWENWRDGEPKVAECFGFMRGNNGLWVGNQTRRRCPFICVKEGYQEEEITSKPPSVPPSVQTDWAEITTVAWGTSTLERGSMTTSKKAMSTITTIIADNGTLAPSTEKIVLQTTVNTNTAVTSIETVGKIVGISAGAAVFILLAVGSIGFICVRLRRHKRNTPNELLNDLTFNSIEQNRAGNNPIYFANQICAPMETGEPEDLSISGKPPDISMPVYANFADGSTDISREMNVNSQCNPSEPWPHDQFPVYAVPEKKTPEDGVDDEDTTVVDNTIYDSGPTTEGNSCAHNAPMGGLLALPCSYGKNTISTGEPSDEEEETTIMDNSIYGGTL